jgi:hypothetical protein
VGDGCTRIADKHVLEDWNRLATRYLFHRFPVSVALIVDIDTDHQLVLQILVSK